jgi:hypothetical protein
MQIAIIWKNSYEPFWLVDSKVQLWRQLLRDAIPVNVDRILCDVNLGLHKRN